MCRRSGVKKNSSYYPHRLLEIMSRSCLCGVCLLVFTSCFWIRSFTVALRCPLVLLQCVLIFISKGFLFYLLASFLMSLFDAVTSLDICHLSLYNLKHLCCCCAEIHQINFLGVLMPLPYLCTFIFLSSTRSGSENHSFTASSRECATMPLSALQHTRS